MAKEEKKYYAAYREGVLTSDIVEEINVYCTEDKIPLPNWYEIDKEEAQLMIADGHEFKEL